MSKKKCWIRIPVITLLLVALLFSGVSALAASETITVSVSQLSGDARDKISIIYEVNTDKGILDILVSGVENEILYRLSMDDTRYEYRWKAGERAAIPLNMGSGEYELMVGAIISDTRARVLWRATLSVELDCELVPFLNPSVIVNWTNEMRLVNTAKRLAVDDDPRETALAFGKYIAERFSYDYDITQLPSGYIPDLFEIYDSKKGVCYDYAALFAAMCREVGIPTKLIMGYSAYIGPEYHAWCLVMIDGQWHKFDPIYSMYRGVQFLNASRTVEVRQY